jgi:hypothetical protein
MWQPPFFPGATFSGTTAAGIAKPLILVNPAMTKARDISLVLTV